MRAAIPWYDAIARFYERATLGDWFYHTAHREAVEQLRLPRGATVLDLFCGTGVNFPLLSEPDGSTGTIAAVDGSSALLRRSVWSELERRAEDVQIDVRHPFRIWRLEVLDASVIVASGRKPSPA